MSGLLYREDMDEVRARLTKWWNGGDIGRPAMQVIVPRKKPLEHVPVMPEPADWLTDYSTSNFEYRVNLAARQCVNQHYLAEAVPAVAPDLAPNCLALYLGCRGVEMPGTVWCQPCITSPETARFELRKDNFYWDFSQRLAREQLRLGKGKFLLSFPDFIEGLDTLAAMRETQTLLIDLLERPEWVQRCLRQITDRYFHCYDILYNLIRDEVGGSIFWAWAPGRMTKLQCDMSAMISPEMFRDFMVPVLTEMCARVSYCMYHWDGPGAIKHHDLLLGIPRLNMLQWTAGAGVEPTWHRRWWPLYHKTIDAGKKVNIGVKTAAQLKTLKKEFGAKLTQFLIGVYVPDLKQAREMIKLAEI